MKQNWIKKQRSIYLPEANPSTAFSFHLHENIAIFRSELGNSSDLSIRECKIGTEKISAAILWINGMVDQKTVNETVLNPLLQQSQQLNITETENVYELLRDSIISAQEVSFEQTVDSTISRLLLGYSILLVHGFVGGIAINTQGYEVRSIEEPASSAVLRGPRDGFIESLAINLSLIRRRIKNKNLRVETHRFWPFDLSHRI